MGYIYKTKIQFAVIKGSRSILRAVYTFGWEQHWKLKLEFNGTSLVFEAKVLPCLFSYQILTSRSFFPDVANRVPSGLNVMWCTGVAVWQVQMHSQAISSSFSFVGVFGSRSPPISNLTTAKGERFQRELESQYSELLNL